MDFDHVWHMISWRNLTPLSYKSTCIYLHTAIHRPTRPDSLIDFGAI